MDLNYLKENAQKYAYECRKFFPEDEALITHFITKNQVVVISTKRLFVYYYRNIIDVVFDELSQCDINEIQDDKNIVNITIEGKVFTLEFLVGEDHSKFLTYFKKYS